MNEDMIEVNRSMRATIRRAAESDAPGLLRLNEKFNGKSMLSAEQIRLSLAVNDREDVFVAEQEGKLVGFCCVQIFQSFCYEVRYAEITELYVDDAYQRRGIGRELLGYVEQYYEDTDIKGFQLFTGGGNVSAQAFYEKLGYKRTSEVMYRKRKQL